MEKGKPTYKDLENRIAELEKLNEELSIANEKAKLNELKIQNQINDLQTLEKELANTNILIQSAFDQSPVSMVVVAAPDFKFKLINHAMENIVLEKASDYLNKTPLEAPITWKDCNSDGIPQKSVTELPLPMALNGITTKNKESRIIRHDGSSVWVLSSAAPIYNKEQALIGAIYTANDITEFKRIEDKLKESEKTLLSKNCEYEALNEELKQINLELQAAKEKAEENNTIIQHQYNELQSSEEEIRAANEELMATSDALKESYKELLLVKEKAEENEIKFKGLFHNMNNSASHYEVIYNNEGIPVDYRFLDVNAFYEKIIGLKASDVVGKTLLEVFPSTEQLWLDTFKEVVITSKPTVIESYSQEVEMYFELIVYIPQKGKMAMIGSDITKRKLNELEVIKAKEQAEESDQLKSAFLENISHEVRTPMNAILGFSELLMKPNLTNEKRKEFTMVLQKATYQLLNIIDHTITLAHIETKQLQMNKMEFSPITLLESLFEEFNTKKQLMGKLQIKLIIKNPEATDFQIKNDYTWINEIFNILLDNALKFTEKGTIEFGFTLETNKINFFVKDTGFGIPHDKQQLIFKSFVQADKNIRQMFGGLGVGLTIVLGLVKLLDGQIIINSELNQGTEIIFSLPND